VLGSYLIQPSLQSCTPPRATWTASSLAPSHLISQLPRPPYAAASTTPSLAITRFYTSLPLATFLFTLVYPILPYFLHGNNLDLAHRNDDFLILFSFLISRRLLALNSLSFSLKTVSNEDFTQSQYEVSERAEQT
jgi:hypothetical protein